MARKQSEWLESRLEAELDGLFRFAYRLTGRRHDAEDLVQDVCARALEARPELPGAAECRRWLFRVLYNRFVDGRRHDQRSPFVRATADTPRQRDAPGTSRSPDEIAAQVEEEDAMSRAWARLEPAQQALLMLRIEGYDLTEMRSITAIGKPALTMRLRRARLSFARFLEQERNAPVVCAAAGGKP